jgi:hypothetical protein
VGYFKLLPERRPYGTKIGASRLFRSGSLGPELVVIETGKRVTLEIAGLTGTPVISQLVWKMIGSGFLPDFRLPVPVSGAPDVVSLSSLTGGGARRRVTLTALRPGTCLLFVDGANPLAVLVGHFENHPGMEHDLIASVFRSADPEKMHILVRTLSNDPDNLFNEQSSYNVGKWGPLACGTVSKVGGAAVFHEKLNYDSNVYYQLPVRGKTRDGIKIDSAKLSRGRKAIQARLAKGIPSIVGLVYKPSSAIRSNGYIDVNGTGGHTVPIVGCSSDGKTFLYIDVFQEGSKLHYEGGHAGRDLFSEDCDYLGMFELQHDASRGIDILRSTTPGKVGTFQGAQFLEVVAGPLS